MSWVFNGVINQTGSPAIYSDILANIPTPGYVGRLFISTDTLAWYRDTGTSWELLGGSGTGSITGSGTAGAIPKFSGSGVISNSIITESGTSISVAGSITANSIIKSGATSSQFLKGDGSADSTTYIATSAIGSTVQSYNANTTILGNTTTGSGSTIVLSGSPTLVLPNIAAINVSGGIATLPSGTGTLIYGANTIKNQTTTQTGASFNIDGSGTVGNSLTVGSLVNVGTYINLQNTAGNVLIDTPGVYFKNYNLQNVIQLQGKSNLDQGYILFGNSTNIFGFDNTKFTLSNNLSITGSITTSAQSTFNAGLNTTTINGGTITFLNNNTVYTANTIVGFQAGANLTPGTTYNTLVGFQAGTALTSGYNNTFLGMQSGIAAVSGYANTGVGIQTLFQLTTGSFNFAGGIHALYSLTTGQSNNIIGGGAMEYLVDGTGNNAIGMYAGNFAANGSTPITSNDYGVYIGHNAYSLQDNSTNEIVIGATMAGNGSNTVSIGNSSITQTTLQGNLGLNTNSPVALLDINTKAPYNNFRVYARSITDMQLSFCGTPTGAAFEHAGLYMGRDATVYSYGSYLAFYTEGKNSGTTDTSTEKGRFDSIGNFGINTTTPTEKLTVVGNGVLTGSLTANSIVKSGATNAQILAGDGSIITAGTNITISGGTISAAASGSSGIYTPTLTNVINTSSLINVGATYLRVGNIVTVSCGIAGNCTASASNQLTISLPAGAAFVSGSEGFGSGVDQYPGSGGIMQTCEITANIGSANMIVTFKPDATVTTFSFKCVFQYQVQ